MKHPIETVMHAWAQYILDVKRDDDNTLYGSLKRPNEEALETLREIVDSLSAYPPKQMVEPLMT